MTKPSQRGSAAVEFALVLPLALIASLALVQVGLLGRDAAVVALAAREASREATVSTDDSRAREAALRAGNLASERTEVLVHRTGGVGDPVRVEVVYRGPVVVPFVGWLFPDEVRLVAEATMRQEASGTELP